VPELHQQELEKIRAAFDQLKRLQAVAARATRAVGDETIAYSDRPAASSACRLEL
jgi:hypothetical protein